MRDKPARWLSVFAFLLLTLLISNPSYSQPISHQNWQTATIINDSITVSCADLRLPFEKGSLLSEPTPTTARGDMDYALRSPHPVKVLLNAETGTTDTLSSIGGCTINGARIQISPAVSGVAITVLHTSGQIEFPDGQNVVLNSIRQILTLQRKSGIWVLDSGFGSGSGGSTSGGKVWNDLDGSANAAKFLDSSNNGFLIFGDTDGGHLQCIIDDGGQNLPCDFNISIVDTKNFVLSLAGVPALTVTSTGVSTLGEAMKEIHTVWVPAGMMEVDGTQCTKNTDVILSAANYPATIDCTDNDAASIYFDVYPGNAWDAAYLTLTGVWFQGDSTPDGNYNIDWAGYCASDSDPFFHTTFSTETAMDFAPSTYAQNDGMVITTAGLTLSGTCAKGDMVRIRGQVDATGTTAAAPTGIHLLRVGVNIKVDSWSN